MGWVKMEEEGIERINGDVKKMLQHVNKQENKHYKFSYHLEWTHILCGAFFLLFCFLCFEQKHNYVHMVDVILTIF